MTLSVCLIVKDEQDVIARCLSCVKKFADEIIVVDTGSSDGTWKETENFTDNIYFYEWDDDFSAARNFAFSQATCDYVMWLDADDVISDENCLKIKNLLTGETFDVAFLRYAAAFDGDTPTFVYYRERIFARAKNFKFQGAVHEAVEPCGKQIYSDAEIWHKKEKEGEPFRNLRIYQKQIARGISLDERSQFYYGRELLNNRMYRESIAVTEKFLKGDGWIENKIEACVNLFYAYMYTGRKKLAYKSLLKSFLYDKPRSQACCILGEKFMIENDLGSAIYWYKQAVLNKPELSSGGFVNLDFCGFIPYMQLCVLYYKLGDFEKSNYYNEEAGKIKPHNQNYLNNRKYFLEKSGNEV